ncbi:TetR family transcriptional regulator [Pseudoclavibacter endophyticus]|uniref:TetR/AcrR family transcriptional regulator n=1 Tax=Pseudoclavibacter endophyticus TaxID=1778590 RepID=A0A6H9WP00_9MICO|nr:TetR/AcrR family transcriptional regulator [Pseudoclavibacter endophyticus]KAB1648346.1 TetR/AcrR family transcriptional regulator [Pseudoclavibacter endophyticus]GGA71855.1 TetR family transcriptional regulator [Pseudoclavibacter endophyticus]
MAEGTRDRILDALEALLLEDGAPGITLEAVAARAEVSKGGLLYHFPGKEQLLVGAVERLGERVAAQLDTAIANGESIARWYLEPADTESDTDVAMTRSILAVMRSADGAYDEVQRHLVRIMRRYDAHLVAELGDPVKAEIVRLMGDGVYLGQIIGMPAPDPELHRQAIERLLGGDASSGETPGSSSP